VAKKQTDDVLAQRGLYWRSTFPELAQINKALAARYGVPSAEELQREPAAEMTGYADLANWRAEATKQRAEALFWRLIAYHLAGEARIPAFREPRSDKYSDSLPAWIAGGGCTHDAPPDFLTFDQARFVLAIREIEQGSGLTREKAPSREWIFRWLLNIEVPTTPERAAARRERIPLRYRGINSDGTMNLAYYKIPEAIREFPERYLPAADPRREPQHWPGWDGDPSGPTVTSARET
jgi:hypothetical protein